MPDRFVHRLPAADAATRQHIAALSSAQQAPFIRGHIPAGRAVAPVISAWCQAPDGSLVRSSSARWRRPACPGSPA